MYKYQIGQKVKVFSHGRDRLYLGKALISNRREIALWGIGVDNGIGYQYRTAIAGEDYWTDESLLEEVEPTCPVCRIEIKLDDKKRIKEHLSKKGALCYGSYMPI